MERFDQICCANLPCEPDIYGGSDFFPLQLALPPYLCCCGSIKTSCRHACAGPGQQTSAADVSSSGDHSLQSALFSEIALARTLAGSIELYLDSFRNEALISKTAHNSFLIHF